MFMLLVGLCGAYKIHNNIVVGWSTSDAHYTFSARGAWDELDPRVVQCAVGQRVSSCGNLLKHTGVLHHITHAHALFTNPRIVCLAMLLCP